MKRFLESESQIIVFGAAVTLLIGTLVFGLLPQYPAVRGSQPLDVLTPLSYQIGIFVPFGILLTESILALLKRDRGTLVISGFVFGGLCFVSLLRLLFYIPVSGHCLVLSYFLPHQLVTNEARYPFRFLSGVVVLLQVMHYKVVEWDDLITPLTGFGLGFGIWIVSYVAARMVISSGRGNLKPPVAYPN